MQSTIDGKTQPRILTPLRRRRDFIESRLIIFRYLSKGWTFVTAATLKNCGKLLETLAESMDYSVNAPSPINEEKMTKELIFISLVSQGTSLPDEMTEVIIFSRLLNTKSMGIRGAYWVARGLLNMPALMPLSPPTTSPATASPGPDALPTISQADLSLLRQGPHLRGRGAEARPSKGQPGRLGRPRPTATERASEACGGVFLKISQLTGYEPSDVEAYVAEIGIYILIGWLVILGVTC